MELNNRRVIKFKQDLQEMKVRFEATKKQQESQKLEQSRDSLLRRPNRGTNVVSFLRKINAISRNLLFLLSLNIHTNHYLETSLHYASNHLLTIQIHSWMILLVKHRTY